MKEDRLYSHYQEYQSYIGSTEADEKSVRAAAIVLEPYLCQLIDDFYAEVARHAATRKVVEDSKTNVERLKATLLQWLRELLAGPRDRDYVARRWQVGKRHVEVGLEQVYVSVAMARLRAGLIRTLGQHWPGKQEELTQAILALSQLLDLDLTIIENAYQTEYLARIRRNEQLAKIGHVAGSVGHELREPLNVLKMSAYYLRHADPASPKRTEHFRRIESSMGVAEQVLLELSNFAAMTVPRLRPLSVANCMDAAVEQARLPDNIQLVKSFPRELPLAMGDGEQMRHVFLCLARSAQDRMRDGGRLCITGQDMTEGVEVVFEDTGESVSEARLAALEAPLSWSSVRVLGMNLAIAKALLDGNRGSLRGEHQPGNGCKMTVTATLARVTTPTDSAPP
jgi:two-component system, NtrC family, sensor kinase